MTLSEAKGILQMALQQPMGLLLKSNDPTRARARLYAAQRQIPEASDLQFRASPWPDEGNLLVVKRRLQLPRPMANSTSSQSEEPT